MVVNKGIRGEIVANRTRRNDDTPEANIRILTKTFLDISLKSSSLKTLMV